MGFVHLKTKSIASNEDNMIPLINVVFLMLIFFMIAGVIRESDQTNIIYPASLNNHKLAKDVITLEVNKDESILFEQRVLNPELLTLQLKQQVKTRQNISDLHVVLKVDRTLSAQALHKVLKSIRSAGLLKVQLLTEYGESV